MHQVEIRVKGLIDEKWSAWFDDMEISHIGSNLTVLHGSIPDQAALYGLIAKIRDLGLSIRSLDCLEPDIDHSK